MYASPPLYHKFQQTIPQDDDTNIRMAIITEIIIWQTFFLSLHFVTFYYL